LNLLRLKAIAKKELLQIWRDPRSLLIVLAMPAMQMFLLGYGVNLDVKHIPVCADDKESSQNSQALMKGFQASPYFTMAQVVHDDASMQKGLDNGRCRIAIVIPADFSERLADSGSTSVQAVVDATDDNTAALALSYAQAVVATFAATLQQERATAAGRPAPRFQGVLVQSRVWFNEDLVSRNYIIPGIVAMVMALVGAQLTSLTIAREWERGTMELLVSTPVTPMEVMLGKLFPYFCIGMIDAVFCLLLAIFWFDVPFRGSVATLFVASALFLIVVLGIGYLLSVTIRSQLGASQMALLLTMLPTSLLSGYAFPIDQMPAPVQAVTYLVYARYYVEILKGIFLKGAGVADLARPLSLLALYALVIAFFAVRAFRKTLD
jgi:ABC-2 type transport system permease protein